MATNFPNSVDTFSNPSPTSGLDNPSHSGQHADANDAIEAIETFLLNNDIILQVVSTTKTDTFTTSSATFTPVTGLSATITPRSTNSKILVIAQIAHGLTNNTGFGSAKVTRGGTDVYVAGAASGQVLAVYGGFTDVNLRGILLSNSIVFVDSPSSISAETYQVEVRQNGAGSVHINRGELDGGNASNARGASSITLLEII